MARSSRFWTFCSSGCAAVPCSDGSRAITTLDFPACAVSPSIAAIPSLPPELISTAPVAASFRNCLRSFIAFLALVVAAGSRPVWLEFLFHAMRQRHERLLRCRRVLVCNNAHQVRPLAEGHALRVGNACIAERHGFRILALACLEDLARPVRIAHRVNVHDRFQLALILVRS